jgi:hypothetical protein
MRMPTCSILVLLLICTTSYGQTRGAGKVVTRLPSGDHLDLYDNSWAVVIGINNYDKWPDLQYAVNDARAIRDRMMTLGFPEVNISYIIDEEATKTNIERLLGDTMRRKVGEKVREIDGEVAFYCVQPILAKTFQIMGLLGRAEIYDTEEEALVSLAP